MKIHDQHVHSYYSFDSDQSIEEYINKSINLGLDYFIVTDHIDLNHISSEKDIDFDIDKQQKELDTLQTKFKSIKILKGVEIGYVKTDLKRIKDILQNYSFDLINYSLHENGKIDYYYKDEFLKQGTTKLLNTYFDNVLEALNAGIDFDVLCHFDYGFKTAFLIDETLKISMFKEKIIAIFNRLIEMDKCLEINIKVQSFLNEEHTMYILNLYKTLGGKNITLSTDAHKVDKFCEGMEYYISLIKKAGFDHLNYFVNRDRFDYMI